MGRVFIPTYTDRKTHKKRKSSNYHVEFEDHQGISRRVVGFPVTTGEQRSNGLKTKLEKLVACRVTKDPLPADVREFVDDLKPKLRDKLIEWNIIDAPSVVRNKPISFHLIGYIHHMKAKGNTTRHIRQTVRRMGEIIKQADMHLLSDITASRVKDYLTSRRIGQNPIKPKTANYYLTAINGFCNWLVKPAGRLSHNPLNGVESLTEVDEETRWPLTVDEMRTLLEKTSNGPTRYNLDGVERSLIYRFAVETGYRVGELRSLIRESFDLDTDKPIVRLLAGSSKGKRRSKLPLRPDTAALLREHLATKAPAAKAFRIPSRTADMIRDDMIDAGIPISDALGRVRDFHALRHTTGTWLVNAGVHPKETQTILRHSTITLTMDLYAHTNHDRASEAIGQMPDLSDEAIAATGTEDACAMLAPERELLATNMDKSGQTRDGESNREIPRNTGKQGENQVAPVGFEPTRPIRTTDFKSAASANSATGPVTILGL